MNALRSSTCAKTFVAVTTDACPLSATISLTESSLKKSQIVSMPLDLDDHHDICPRIHAPHPQAVPAKASTEKYADVAVDINGEIALTEPEALDHAVGEFGTSGPARCASPTICRDNRYGTELRGDHTWLRCARPQSSHIMT